MKVSSKKLSQRALMRELNQRFHSVDGKIIAAYANAERLGMVCRASNVGKMSPEEYARALLADARRKGWL